MVVAYILSGNGRPPPDPPPLHSVSIHWNEIHVHRLNSFLFTRCLENSTMVGCTFAAPISPTFSGGHKEGAYNAVQALRRHHLCDTNRTLRKRNQLKHPFSHYNRWQTTTYTNNNNYPHPIEPIAMLIPTPSPPV